jgi:iron complex outermembrane recepter protein
MNTKIAHAVAVVLGGVSFAAAAASPDPQSTAAATATGGDSIGEIIVTAQRRSESIQDVPIAIQALTSQTLQQLNISTFDDFIKYLPNVTSANNGPGQNEVFMRGLSAGSQASQASGITGIFPNVAIYLDNQSGLLPNRNLDVYAADLNRIEVLEGPQGTLFGAGAEAGVIRYITNEPKLDVVEANVTAGYGATAHGDPNSNVTAVLNLPVIAGTMAVRGVIYDDQRGGYINNVPGTFTRAATDVGIHYAGYPTGCGPNSIPAGPPCKVPPGSPVINNYNIAGSAINPVTYKGIRVEAQYKFNDDWDMLITQSYQDMESQGVFYQQTNASDGAPLRPLEVTLFNPSHDSDKFESTAWTVNGRLGDLKAVYTGGYLVRNVDQTADYTNYARGVYADYYQCYGPQSAANALQSTCFSPSSAWHDKERNTHQQHEFRLSTPDEWRLRAIGGVFWEDNKIDEVLRYSYKSIPACTSNGAPGTAGNTGCESDTGSIPGTTLQEPGIQSDSTSWMSDEQRDTKQTAFFASADFDLIPKVLTLTAGTRFYHFQNSLVGDVLSSFGCFEAGTPPTGCHNPAYSYNVDAEKLSGSESGQRSRANIAWHITPDVMAYYTFSQGFRPGGFNQNGGALHAYGTDGVYQYAIPNQYLSDKLTNNELGWKTELFDNHLQWNGAIYREDWNNVQVEFFNPGVAGNLFYNTNGQNFVIQGLETSLLARPLYGLTLQGAASWNQSRQTNSPALIDNNPASANFGKPITQVCNSSGANCTPVGNPFGPIGAPSADAPPIQFSLRGRYEWDVSGYTPFVQIGVTHTGHTFTQAGSNPTITAGAAITTSRLRFEIPAYSTYSASFGVAKDAWWVNVYGENLSNSNASTFISSDQFIVAQTPLRPRVIGASFGYKL